MSYYSEFSVGPRTSNSVRESGNARITDEFFWYDENSPTDLGFIPQPPPPPLVLTPMNTEPIRLDDPMDNYVDSGVERIPSEFITLADGSMIPLDEFEEQEEIVEKQMQEDEHMEEHIFTTLASNEPGLGYHYSQNFFYNKFFDHNGALKYDNMSYEIFEWNGPKGKQTNCAIVYDKAKAGRGPWTSTAFNILNFNLYELRSVCGMGRGWHRTNDNDVRINEWFMRDYTRSQRAYLEAKIKDHEKMVSSDPSQDEKLQTIEQENSQLKKSNQDKDEQIRKLEADLKKCQESKKDKPDTMPPTRPPRHDDESLDKKFGDQIKRDEEQDRKVQDQQKSIDDLKKRVDEADKQIQRLQDDLKKKRSCECGGSESDGKVQIPENKPIPPAKRPRQDSDDELPETIPRIMRQSKEGEHADFVSEETPVGSQLLNPTSMSSDVDISHIYQRDVEVTEYEGITTSDASLNNESAWTMEQVLQRPIQVAAFELSRETAKGKVMTSVLFPNEWLSNEKVRTLAYNSVTSHMLHRFDVVAHVHVNSNAFYGGRLIVAFDFFGKHSFRTGKYKRPTVVELTNMHNADLDVSIGNEVELRIPYENIHPYINNFDSYFTNNNLGILYVGCIASLTVPDGMNSIVQGTVNFIGENVQLKGLIPVNARPYPQFERQGYESRHSKRTTAGNMSQAGLDESIFRLTLEQKYNPTSLKMWKFNGNIAPLLRKKAIVSSEQWSVQDPIGKTVKIIRCKVEW